MNTIGIINAEKQQADRLEINNKKFQKNIGCKKQYSREINTNVNRPYKTNCIAAITTSDGTRKTSDRVDEIKNALGEDKVLKLELSKENKINKTMVKSDIYKTVERNSYKYAYNKKLGDKKIIANNKDKNRRNTPLTIKQSKQIHNIPKKDRVRQNNKISKEILYKDKVVAEKVLTAIDSESKTKRDKNIVSKNLKDVALIRNFVEGITETANAKHATKINNKTNFMYNISIAENRNLASKNKNNAQKISNLESSRLDAEILDIKNNLTKDTIILEEIDNNELKNSKDILREKICTNKKLDNKDTLSKNVFSISTQTASENKNNIDCNNILTDSKLEIKNKNNLPVQIFRDKIKQCKIKSQIFTNTLYTRDKYKNTPQRWRDNRQPWNKKKQYGGRPESDIDRCVRVANVTVKSAYTSNKSVEKMISQEEINNIHKEEDNLLEEIRKEAILRELQLCRNERLRMLRSIAERKDNRQRPSMQAIEQMQQEETERTGKIMRSLSDIRQTEYMRKVFFKKFTLLNDINSQELETTAMISQEEIIKLREEEDKIVEEIKKQALLREINACRQQRIEMLRSFANSDDIQTSSMQEIQRMHNEERERTNEVMKCLADIGSKETIGRFFIKKFTLVDDVQKQEAEITVAVTLRNKTQVTGLIRPININCTIDNNSPEMTMHTMFLGNEDIVVPGDISKASFQLQTLPLNSEGEENAEQSTDKQQNRLKKIKSSRM